MAETTNNNTNQVPKYTPEQEAARKDPALASTPSGAGAGAVGQPQTGVSTGQTVTGQAPGAGFGTSTTGVRDVAMEEANRAKMLETGELKAGGNEQLAQEKVNMFTYGVGAPVFGAIDSSATAAEEVGGYAEDISAGLADVAAKKDTPEYKYYSDYEKQIQESRDKGEDLYGRLMENIEEDYRIRELEQRDENRITTGAQSKQLARMGAYGRSGSAMSYMQDVDRTNQRHLNKLLMEKERLLIEATSAFEAQDYGKVQDLITANKDIVDQYNEVEQMMFQDSLMSAEEVRTQARFGWDKEDRVMGKIYNLADSGIPLEELSDGEITQMENDAGLLPGTFEALYHANQDAISQKKEFDYQNSLADLSGKIPDGQTFSIGGKTYYGTKTTDKFWRTTEMDENGNVTGLSFNKATGKWQTPVSLGNIGAPTDYNEIITNADGDVFQHNSLTNETVGVYTSKTEQVNPIFLDGFTNWADSLGGVNQHPGDTDTSGGHSGVDIKAGFGTSVRPLVDGKVIWSGNKNDGFGNYVIVQDDEGRQHYYAHFSDLSVRAGDLVDSNTQLGLSGNSGNVWTDRGGPLHKVTPEERMEGAGSHLHYEVRAGEKTQLNIGADPEITETQEAADVTATIAWLKGEGYSNQGAIDYLVGQGIDTSKYVKQIDLAIPLGADTIGVPVMRTTDEEGKEIVDTTFIEQRFSDQQFEDLAEERNISGTFGFDSTQDGKDFVKDYIQTLIDQNLDDADIYEEIQLLFKK